MARNVEYFIAHNSKAPPDKEPFLSACVMAAVEPEDKTHLHILQTVLLADAPKDILPTALLHFPSQ